MEKLRFRTILIGAFLIAVGIAIQVAPATNLSPKDEVFMEKSAPTKVGEFSFYGDTLGKKPNQSYAIGQEAYDILRPFGIVGRVYATGSDGYDVLLVSSNKKESFHDQRVCFTASGWTLTGQTQDVLETARGQVPISFVTMKHRLKGDRVAALFYKGPADRGLLPTLSRIVMVGAAAALVVGLGWLVVPAFFSKTRSRSVGIVFTVMGAAALVLAMTAMSGPVRSETPSAGDSQFYDSPSSLTFAMLKEQLAGGTNMDSTFYRFIPTRNVSKEELGDFIKSYLVEAEKTSAGYF
ncbi:MAG: hypothetical protein WAO58_02290 [Fimbriimonadaceae bacterium]